MDTAETTRAAIAARVRAEGLISLEQAATMFPADNHRGHVSPSTLLRWIVSGKAGTRLEGARLRGTWHTSLAALMRFRATLGL